MLVEIAQVGVVSNYLIEFLPCRVELCFDVRHAELGLRLGREVRCVGLQYW